MEHNGFQIDQVGIVVHDLDRALERYEHEFGGGPWRTWTYGPEVVPRLSYQGADAAFTMRIALSSSRPQIELIQPVDGPNLYSEWLERHGEGLHHLGMFEDDLGAGEVRMAEHGYRLIQSGRGYGLDGDGAFLYYDATEKLGVILELIEVPARRLEPELVWPPAPATEAVR